MLFDLHTHTIYSKGTKVLYEGLDSPEEMVKYAGKKGLDGIAITDHNKIKGALRGLKFSKKHKKYEVTVIPGEEVSTQEGHVLALGIQEKIPRDLSLMETLDRVHEQGGISIAAHPFDIRRKGVGEKAVKCDVIEVFNSMALEKISNKKCEEFVSKRNLPLVSGSDAHCKEMLGYGVTKVDGEKDEVLGALKKGKVEIYKNYYPLSVLTQWGVTRLKLSYEYVLNYIDENYFLPKRVLSRGLLSLVKKSPGRVDLLFKGLARIGLSGAKVYGLIRNTLQV